MPEHVPLPALLALVEHVADAAMVEAGIGLAASGRSFPGRAHAQGTVGIDGPAAFTDGLFALFFRCGDEFAAVGNEPAAARIPFPGLVEIHLHDLAGSQWLRRLRAACSMDDARRCHRKTQYESGESACAYCCFHHSLLLHCPTLLSASMISPVATAGGSGIIGSACISGGPPNPGTEMRSFRRTDLAPSTPAPATVNRVSVKLT